MRTSLPKSMEMLIVSPDFHKKLILNLNALEPVVNLIEETQLDSLLLSAERRRRQRKMQSFVLRKALPKELHQYFDHKLQLTIHNGCILYGHIVVKPSTLQQQILTDIHEDHMGIVRWSLTDSIVVTEFLIGLTGTLRSVYLTQFGWAVLVWMENRDYKTSMVCSAVILLFILITSDHLVAASWKWTTSILRMVLWNWCEGVSMVL